MQALALRDAEAKAHEEAQVTCCHPSSSRGRSERRAQNRLQRKRENTRWQRLPRQRSQSEHRHDARFEVRQALDMWHALLGVQQLVSVFSHDLSRYLTPAT